MSTQQRTTGHLKTYALLLFVALCGGAYLQHQAQAAAAPDKKGRAAQVERGRTIYMQNCARCHGATGRSDTDQGELYGASKLADAAWWKSERINDRRLTASITNGKKGGMPAYGKKLSKGDITAVVAFVHTLKQ